jgi:hypothetical protein
MTREEFISREIATWGEDYIFALFDKGYVAVELTDGSHFKWTWHLAGLTNAPNYGTVKSGSVVGFTPVYPANRASGTNAV